MKRRWWWRRRRRRWSGRGAGGDGGGAGAGAGVGGAGEERKGGVCNTNGQKIHRDTMRVSVREWVYVRERERERACVSCVCVCARSVLAHLVKVVLNVSQGHVDRDNAIGKLNHEVRIACESHSTHHLEQDASDEEEAEQ